MRRQFLSLLFVLSLSTGAFAVTPDEVLSDPGLENRAREISAELRCLVCQNQSIDDSDADLARDLRVLVRERLSAGDSDGEVFDYIVARYGEFVLLKPRLGFRTALLWGAPGLLLLGGIVFLVLQKRKVEPQFRSLDAEEEERLEAILKED